jgi:hypothetical protein
LWIYRWEGEFKVVKKIEGGKLDRYLAVDVVDTKKNGRAEIFVTNFQRDRLSSFVVAYNDGDYRIVSSGLAWFFRAVDWGEKGRVLLGQQKGAGEGFVGSIYEFAWDGKKYKESRAAKIPRGVPLYGFAPFFHDGQVDFPFIDSDFRLKVMNEKGKVIWRSKDAYGSDNSFPLRPVEVDAAGPDTGDTLGFVNVRVIAKGNEIFVLHNISPIGQFLKRTQYYNRGQVQRLVWTGALFMEAWRSQEISGYLADFQFQEGKQDQARELIVAVNLPRESLLSGGGSSALMVNRLQAIR